MEEYLIEINRQAQERAHYREGDYVDSKGLLVCGICGEHKQVRGELLGKEKLFYCMCRCEKEAYERRQEEIRQQELERQIYQMRSVGLTEKRFWDWKFENDNQRNPKMKLAENYVENWEQMKRENIGLLLFGPVGSGKSFAAGCIANALLDQGIYVMMTNFSRIMNELTKYGADKNQIIDQLVSYPLLIIDDLGIERRSEFALEQIYNLIDRRYCMKKPMIVTTNLTYEEMQNAALEEQRLYSRLFEMCLLVKWEGADLRKETHDKKIQLLREME